MKKISPDVIVGAKERAMLTIILSPPLPGAEGISRPGRTAHLAEPEILGQPNLLDSQRLGRWCRRPEVELPDAAAPGPRKSRGLHGTLLQAADRTSYCCTRQQQKH